MFRPENFTAFVWGLVGLTPVLIYKTFFFTKTILLSSVAFGIGFLPPKERTRFKAWSSSDPERLGDLKFGDLKPPLCSWLLIRGTATKFLVFSGTFSAIDLVFVL